MSSKLSNKSKKPCSTNNSGICSFNNFSLKTSSEFFSEFTICKAFFNKSAFLNAPINLSASIVSFANCPYLFTKYWCKPPLKT